LMGCWAAYEPRFGDSTASARGGGGAMKLPEEFWRSVERVPLSAEPARPLALLRDDVREVVRVLDGAPGERHLVWRGHSNADYGISSSLFRSALSLHSVTALNEQRLFDLEREILAYARSRGLGRCMNDLQLLHALQHYGVPTRLIDVSRDPISALWFAVNAMARKDGRLFLIAVPNEFVRPDDSGLRMLPWSGIELRHWTNQLLLLDAPASNPRLAAQDGAFMVGGLARNYAGKQRLMKDHNGNWRYVPADQIHEICELFIKFPKSITAGMAAKWRTSESYGFTWRIPAKLKHRILTALNKMGVRSDTMYPDFDSAALDFATSLHLT
jgi:hypothetical protein